MFNIDKFHNQLALSLGYERIVNDKKMTISVEESDEPWVTLKVNGYEDIRFKASEETDSIELKASPGMNRKIKAIADSAHHAYLLACQTFG